MTGSLVALELAECGLHVDLFDRADSALAGASFANEGKIHLGFVYAKDAPERTARTMIEGALNFAPLLERWISSAEINKAISTPFVYGLHRDSMLDERAIQSHFEAVDGLIRSGMSGKRSQYVGKLNDKTWRRHSDSEHESVFDPKEIRCSYVTDEVAVDTHRISELVGEALSLSPRLCPLFGREILTLERSRRKLIVHWAEAGRKTQQAAYDFVVNAMWENRSLLDSTIGLKPERSLFHRYKVGFYATTDAPPASLHSVTFVLGSFGDSVKFRDRIYISWYPFGLLHQESHLAPRFQPPNSDSIQWAKVLQDSLGALTKLMPASIDVLGESSLSWQPAGGFISSWGISGIDDPCSELHQRYRVGVHSHENYHSIDSGKYTLAPLFAKQACSRILGSTG
jgi:hypothetical protein